MSLVPPLVMYSSARIASESLECSYEQGISVHRSSRSHARNRQEEITQQFAPTRVSQRHGASARWSGQMT
jgi:hypothetical protein